MPEDILWRRHARHERFCKNFLDDFAATGRVGLRAGIEAQSGDWVLQLYVGLSWEGEMNGRPGTTLSSGDQDLYFRDASEGGRGRWEPGVQGASEGLSVFEG